MLMVKKSHKKYIRKNSSHQNTPIKIASQVQTNKTIRIIKNTKVKVDHKTI